MRIATGRVIAGKIVVEGEPLAEGATVTVLASESDESFELTPEQDALLLASIEEAEAGRVVKGPEVLRDLARNS